MNRLNLYFSREHACHYLPGRRARIAVVDPAERPTTRGYSTLSARGFRRSGHYLYRPACDGCDACRSLRVPVARFTPDRSQRRTLKRNADLRVRTLAPEFNAEHYRLFTRYLQSRHRDGGMDGTDPDAYIGFLEGGWTDTAFHEFRDGGRLLAVAVTDRLADGLSAVYTFYEPDESRRSLGNYAILWQIGAARQVGLRWLYLGYWIGESDKMNYKSRFRPHEILIDGGWRRS